MKRQLQGISLILFAVVLILYAVIDTQLPVVVSPSLLTFAGLVTAIVGLVMTLRGDK